MINIKCKTFWRIIPFGRDKYVSRDVEEWKAPADISLVGARIILLTDGDMQRAIDIYGAVVLDKPQEDFQHDALKKKHLFYGQRDCYQRCAGMQDLTMLDYLPYPYCYKIKKDTPIYFVALANKAGELVGNYDVLIDLFYVEEQK